jgi:putative colanic acid biosynthesis UDP-glucose lipid carrier transferase
MLHNPLPQDLITSRGSPSTDRFFVGVSKFLDAAVIVGVLLASTFARVQNLPVKYVVALLLAILVFQIGAGMASLYRPWRGESVTRQFFRVVLVWTGTFFVLLTIAYLTKTTDQFSRVAMTTWLVATPFALSAWRVAARLALTRLLRRDEHRRNVLVWGGGEIADQLVGTIRGNPGLGLRLVDHVAVPEGDCAGQGAAPRAIDPRAFSATEEIELRAKRGEFSVLYVTLTPGTRPMIPDLLDRLSDTTVSVYMVPDFITTHLFHGHWSKLEGIPIVSVFDTPFWGADGWLKRVQDLVLSAVILALIALPMLVIAGLVKASSPGPVLFRQTRYGFGGRPIEVLKFRTMTVCENGPHVPQARRDDPRVTPIGRFLRRTSLDELPQFINVFRGEMSIVGPRPHAVAHNEFYRGQVKGYMLRHKVKPGITGWAQVNGWRGETDDMYKMERRVEHDLWYIRNWSFWLDIKIILLTVWRGFTGGNVY